MFRGFFRKVLDENPKIVLPILILKFIILTPNLTITSCKFESNFEVLKKKIKKPLKVPSLARSVPKPLKVPSLARSVPKPLKVPSLARKKQRDSRVHQSHVTQAFSARRPSSSRFHAQGEFDLVIHDCDHEKAEKWP